MLLIGLCAGAMAQGKVDSKGSAFQLPPDPILPFVKVTAVEITDGTVGIDIDTKKETLFGYGFMGQTIGSLPGMLTLAMNCSPVIPIPGEVTLAKGGTWTLPVYLPSLRGSNYAGTLYGTVAKGTLNWNKAGDTADVYIVLNVDGGSEAWDGVHGYATFTGTSFVDALTKKTTLKGELVFTIN